MLRHNRQDRDKGFTLIELLVVIIIIGILAGIAIPVFLNQRKKAEIAAVKGDLRAVAMGMETAYIDTNAYPGSLPPGVTLSPNVTVVVSGMSAADANFMEFYALCGTVSSRCEYNFSMGNDGRIWMIWRADSTSSSFGPGEQLPSTITSWFGWTGTAPVVPLTPVAAGASADPTSFCVTGYPTSNPTEKWNWNSKNGGLSKGACA